jgi:hypothetical protein
VRVAHGGCVARDRFSQRDERVDHRHQGIERVKVAGRAVHPLRLFIGNFLANRTYPVPVPAESVHVRQ